MEAFALGKGVRDSNVQRFAPHWEGYITLLMRRGEVVAQRLLFENDLIYYYIGPERLKDGDRETK